LVFPYYYALLSLLAIFFGSVQKLFDPIIPGPLWNHKLALREILYSALTLNSVVGRNGWGQNLLPTVKYDVVVLREKTQLTPGNQGSKDQRRLAKGHPTSQFNGKPRIEKKRGRGSSRDQNCQEGETVWFTHLHA